MPKEAATLVGLCAETIRRYVRSGAVRFKRNPGPRGRVRVMLVMGDFGWELVPGRKSRR